MVSNRPYISVVRDLQKRKAVMEGDILRLQNELAEIDQMIAGLSRLIPRATDDLHRAVNALSGELSGMSMRWAILTILGKDDVAAMAVAEVVDALKAGGFIDSAKLRPNAGAVLSRMVGAGEVENNGNSYSITDKGRDARKVVHPPNAVSLRPSTFEEDDSGDEGIMEGV